MVMIYTTHGLAIIFAMYTFSYCLVEKENQVVIYIWLDHDSIIVRLKVCVGTWRNPGVVSPCTHSSLPLPLQCRRISAWHSRQAPAAEASSVMQRTDTSLPTAVYKRKGNVWQVIPEDLHGRHRPRWVQTSAPEWPWGCFLRSVGTIWQFLAPIQRAICTEASSAVYLSVHQHEQNMFVFGN